LKGFEPVAARATNLPDTKQVMTRKYRNSKKNRQNLVSKHVKNTRKLTKKDRENNKTELNILSQMFLTNLSHDLTRQLIYGQFVWNILNTSKRCN